MPAVPSLDTKPLYALAGAGDAAVNALRTRVVALPALVQVLPAQVKELLPQVRQQALELAGKAEQAYDTFAAQGEKVVAARRGETVKTTAASTKPATKPASKPAAKPAAKRTTAGTPTAASTAAVATDAAATQQTLNGSASV